MSSANLVSVNYIEETTRGETPSTGDFSTARFTSESLSGTPDTTESQQIRTDRLSSGQITTGLTLSGGLDFELAKESALEDFMASAMFSDWVTTAAVTVDLTIDTTAKTITRDSGDFTSDLSAGDMITLQGFSDSNNNTQVMVTSVDSATVISYAGSSSMTDEAGSGTSYQLADYLTIGTDIKSFSIIKRFLDLTTKAINYRGMQVNTMSLNIAHGSLVTGSFGFMGTDYEAVDAAADFMTDGRTIGDPATTNTMNGSIDMPFIASSVAGTLTEEDFCIQELSLDLNNNLTARNCIGKIEADSYNEGTSTIEVSINSYLGDNNWEMLSKKLTQEEFALGFAVKNSGGMYGFYMPAVQVSFDDPASGGINQDVMLDMSGMAKVGANGESSLKIFRA